MRAYKGRQRQPLGERELPKASDAVIATVVIWSTPGARKDMAHVVLVEREPDLHGWKKPVPVLAGADGRPWVPFNGGHRVRGDAVTFREVCSSRTKSMRHVVSHPRKPVSQSRWIPTRHDDASGSHPG